jgi:small subunit ribosomal protein S20
MANNKSALKRIKINERNRLQNKTYKVALKRALKNYLLTVEQYRLDPTETKLNELKPALSNTYQKFDKCVKMNLLHRNTAARKKSNLATLMKMVTAGNSSALDLPKIKTNLSN